MALIECHECGAQVSDHARTCPKCGAPVIVTIKRRQKALLVEFAIRLALGLVTGIVVWFSLRHIFTQALAPLKVMEQKQQSHSK
jgi:ribosomal protein L40E